MGQLINRQPISDEALAEIVALAGEDFEHGDPLDIENNPEVAHLVRKLDADGVTADGIAVRPGIGYCAFAWVD